MGFWCCVVAPKTVLLFIPLLIYIWNRFLEPIWSNYWKKEEKIEMDTEKETTNENSSMQKENCLDGKKIDANVTENSNREKID